ncbi:MAG: polyamine aminopropyltransferase [Candidatus Melainabacteria bacterium]|nr:polyamine aminopropyltransferase [Candidatus Melainabacteria bacterium]
MIKDGWFFEDDMPFGVALQIKGSLYSSKSKYQKIDVLDSYSMGNVMLLDDKLMLTEKDEFYYHETIAHSSLSIHPCPKRVMVIGGGDGGTVREILKYKTIEEVELVEIDEEVINISKKYFSQVACELTNPKLKIKVNDAVEYVKNTKENFYDVILCDSTDPQGFAAGLISKKFYKNAGRSLKEDGIYICQSGSLIIQENEFKTSLENMRTAFKYVDVVVSIVPSYPGCLWSFLIASNKPVDKKVKNLPSGKTKFWNEEMHEKLFTKPAWLKEKYFTFTSLQSIS